MIVRPKPRLFDVLFTLKGSIAKHIALRLVVMTLLACVVTNVARLYPAIFTALGAVPFTLIGLSLSIFMSFRNTACYERWWEGRKQWGLLVVEVRSILRLCAAFEDHPAHAPILRALIGFCHALRARLRDADEAVAAAPWLTDGDNVAGTANPTDAVLLRLGRAAAALAADGSITGWQYQLLEQRFTEVSAIQAACERIKATPVPFAYTLLVHRTAYLFCLLLPFGLAGLLGWATPLITLIVSYAFFGLDALGDELEEPFGFDANDLPLDALVRTMERDIRGALGETDLPPSLVAVDYLLQ